MFSSLCVVLIQGVLTLMVNMPEVNTEQHQIFKRQFQHFLNRNELILCQPHLLQFKDFEVNYEKGRLVKKPGYEILLENVIDGKFICLDGLTLEFYIENELIHYEFEIP